MERAPIIADIFSPEPAQWGLRGDPFLWRDMRTGFVGVPMPASREGLKAELERAFEALTLQRIANDGPVFLEKYSHGGMSSGQVSTAFWRERAIPLLLSRFGS